MPVVLADQESAPTNQFEPVALRTNDCRLVPEQRLVSPRPFVMAHLGLTGTELRPGIQPKHCWPQCSPRILRDLPPRARLHWLFPTVLPNDPPMQDRFATRLTAASVRVLRLRKWVPFRDEMLEMSSWVTSYQTKTPFVKRFLARCGRWQSSLGNTNLGAKSQCTRLRLAAKLAALYEPDDCAPNFSSASALSPLRSSFPVAPSCGISATSRKLSRDGTHRLGRPDALSSVST